MKTSVLTLLRGGVAAIAAEADIRRPAGEVFEYASDPANEPGVEYPDEARRSRS